ncbi:MAG: UDP-N-acetylmuramate dehydrogenase [bacterium JZ-2024 1]
MNSETLKALKRRKWDSPPPILRFDDTLKKHTTYRIGGKVPLFAFVQHKDTLLECLDSLNGEEPFIIGKGSNLLCSDGDFTRPVFRLTGEFERIHIEDNSIEAGGGASIAQLLRRATQAGIGGFEFLAGVPGTVGGAVMNNSGSRLNSILQCTESILAYHWKEKKFVVFSPSDFAWGYRFCSLRGQPLVITSVRLKGYFRPKEDIEAEIQKILQYRKQTQPLSAACAGSVFKNPPGFFAGKLIEECGLKGVSIGKAQVSEVHANFIINRGGASFAEVNKMILYVQETVYRHHKCLLEMEIQVVAPEAP